jgi:hypothetical protein
MTTKRPDGLALAGLGLDKPLLLRVARILLADIYWDDDREREYDGSERELMKRPETPQIQDEIDALIRMAHICGRIEQAWGESFYSLARRLCPPDQTQEDVQEDLVYYTIMACIGHGIGPSECSRIDRFDEDMDQAPIHIDSNPMLFQLSLIE